MISKHKPLKGKVSRINRFNKDPNVSDFLSNFQEIMIQRLNLNHIGKYHKDNVDRIVRSVLKHSSTTKINTSIKNGFLTTCTIDPEIYIGVQETIHKLTGDYYPMDEIIHLLLTYFINTYQGRLPKQQLPFNHKYPGKKFKTLEAFQKRFKKYYKNTVSNFIE